ncbi:MAG: hypothetical protein NZ933_08940, partial [Bacteroidia bacterium]|nr:hypothetical protein [Bacteroidia bacterium]
MEEYLRSLARKSVGWSTGIFLPSYVEEIYTYLDIPVYVAYAIINLILLNTLLKRFRINTEEVTIVRYSWILRNLFAVGIYGFYQYYYGGGDIVNYTTDAKSLMLSLLYNPLQTLAYLTYSLANQDFMSYFVLNPSFHSYWTYARLKLSYIYDYNSQLVGVFYLPFMILAIGSIPASFVLFSTFTTMTQVLFYKYLSSIYPNSFRKTILILFFMPSILSWTTLPFKEAFSLNFIELGLYLLFHYKGIMLARYLLGILLMYLSYLVKPY